jgi:deoxycytidine triphosphate deaminase
MLRDKEISQMVATASPIVSEINASDYKSKESPIQASSVDLSVGEIFRPYSDSLWRHFTSEVGEAHDEVILKQGETVTIRTRECLKMPANVAGIAFPPSRISTKGLLMTNVGHVDAGYQGYLHMTVINMGKKPHSIRRGDRLVSLLLFQMADNAEVSWLERRGGAVSDERSLVQTAQQALSVDFMNVNQRAHSAATNTIMKNTLLQWLLPIVLSVAFVYITMVSTTQSQLSELRGKVDSIGSDIDLGEISNRIDALEKSSK